MPDSRAERPVRPPLVDGPDARPDVRIADRAARQWGVLSLDELRECGLSRQTVSLRVRNGRLHPLYRGVYAVGHANPPREGRLLAATKSCGPNAILSHLAAAELWGFVDRSDRPPDVTVVGPGPHVRAGIRVHRSESLERRDQTWRGGMALTTPARTLLDLSSMLTYRQLRRAVRQAQSIRRVNLHQIVEVMNRAGPRRGVSQLRRIVATGPAPTRSVLEDVVLDLVLAGGLAHPRVNEALHLNGRRVVPDFRWPQQRLVVEADGAAWHDNRLAREDDAERQALLEAHGEHVVRVTWEQAVRHPQQTLSRILAAGTFESRGRCRGSA